MPEANKDKRINLATEGNVIESKYFFFDTTPNSRAQLAIVFGGFERCAADFEINRRTYPYYVLEIPIRGKCDIKIDAKDYCLERGVLGAITPDVAHHYKCNAKEPMEHIFIAFTGSQAKELYENCGLADSNVVELANPVEIQYLAEAILRKGLEKTQYSHELCCSYLRTLLLEQAAAEAQIGKSACASTQTYRKCLHFIDENFSSISSPSQVADTFDINVRYLSRLFKRFGNTSPLNYIMRLKLNKAASMLLTSNLSVKEIAELVGFEDQFHFSRNFKKLHNLSPQHYRDRHLYNS